MHLRGLCWVLGASRYIVCVRLVPVLQARVDLEQWKPAMEIPDKLSIKNWRKSSQWFTLTRRVAQAIVEDQEINEKFSRFCHSHYDDNGTYKLCCSDEHYIPTAIQALGLESEVNCVDGATYVDWSFNVGGHPRSFTGDDLTFDVMRHARNHKCPSDPGAARQSMELTFLHVRDLEDDTCRRLRLHTPEYEPMDPNCMLFFRKIANDSGTLEAATDYMLGLWRRP